MAVTILFIAFFALLLLGVPVAFSLITSSLLTVLYLGLPSGVVVLQTPGSRDFVPVAFYPDAARDRAHLAEIADGAAGAAPRTRARGRSRPGSRGWAAALPRPG